MSGKIIALMGPSGVGKNFAKQAIKNKFSGISELTVFTTRSRRPSDGIDRETDIPVENFFEMQKEGKIIAGHQPFGPDGDWYGFSKEQIDELLAQGKRILTEIHPDNLQLFKQLYGDNVFAVALTAKIEYLRHNLESRASEKDNEIEARLSKAIDEIESIERLREEGLINRAIQVDWDNRDKLSELVINEVKQEMEPVIEKENKIKLR